MDTDAKQTLIKRGTFVAVAVGTALGLAFTPGPDVLWMDNLCQTNPATTCTVVPIGTVGIPLVVMGLSFAVELWWVEPDVEPEYQLD